MAAENPMIAAAMKGAGVDIEALSADAAHCDVAGTDAWQRADRGTADWRCTGGDQTRSPGSDQEACRAARLRDPDRRGIRNPEGPAAEQLTRRLRQSA